MSRLKLTAKPTFLAQVQISVPGEKKLPIIDVTFRHKSKSALDDWLKRSAADNADPVESLDEVIESWKGPATDDDQELAYSKDALRQLLDVFPAADDDFLKAYLFQMRSSRSKN